MPKKPIEPHNILRMYCEKNAKKIDVFPPIAPIIFVRTNENKGNLLYKLNLSAQIKIKGIYYIN